MWTGTRLSIDLIVCIFEEELLSLVEVLHALFATHQLQLHPQNINSVR